MSDGFVPLADFLRPKSAALWESPAENAVTASPMVAEELEKALCDARRFRAGIADAVDAALPHVLEAIARDVLARELELGGAAVALLAERALDRYGDVVRFHVHPSDVDALEGLHVERLPEPTLQPGDLRVELRSGTIELSLTVRLEAALQAWR